MTRAALDTVLTKIGYEEDKKKIVKETVGMMRRFKALMKETLKESGAMNSAMYKAAEKRRQVKEEETEEAKPPAAAKTT
eukprot:9370680-Ditylum_brightwellii.AAC.1